MKSFDDPKGVTNFDALKLFQESGVFPDYNKLIAQAREFFALRPSATTKTGWIFVAGWKNPIPLKSG